MANPQDAVMVMFEGPVPRRDRPPVVPPPAPQAPATQELGNQPDFTRTPLRGRRSPEVSSVLAATTTALGVRVGMDPLVAALLDPRPSEDSVAPLERDKNAPVKAVPGTAFGTTPAVSPADVSQGAVGDCYLLAMMIAIARVRPDVLEQLVHDDGGGNYTVTLYEDHLIGGAKPYTETVTADVPVDVNGNPLYAKANARADGSRPLWPLLIEKAYAKHRGGYRKIVGGEGTTAAQALTKQGGKAYDVGDFSTAEIADKLDGQLRNGAAITASSIHRSLDDLGDWVHGKIGVGKTDVSETERRRHILAPHEYIVKSVDKTAGTIDLINPWGSDHLTGLPLSDFKVAFHAWTVVELGKAPTP